VTHQIVGEDDEGRITRGFLCHRLAVFGDSAFVGSHFLLAMGVRANQLRKADDVEYVEGGGVRDESE
jgi:hypothetical protein